MITLAAAILVLMETAPPSAQLTTLESANAARRPTATTNSDQVICERVQRTGSRLEFDQVCMSALQWKDHRQGQREDFEKVQRIVNQEPSH